MSAPVIAAEITAFHIAGGLLALWAVILSGLGVLRHDFPGNAAGQTAVMAISGVLVLGAIGTAIGTAKDEPKGGEESGTTLKTGKEGSGSATGEGATGAPGTGADSGQEPSGETAQPAPAGGTRQTLTLRADPTGQLRFDTEALSADAGNIRLTMNNPSPTPHNIALEGAGVDEKGKVVSKGGASEIEATVKPGSYTFYCSVDGHRQAGMEGKLTVK